MKETKFQASDVGRAFIREGFGRYVFALFCLPSSIDILQYRVYGQQSMIRGTTPLLAAGDGPGQ